MEEIARVYAEALFDVAKEKGKLDAIREQLGQFADAVDGDRELQVFFFSPYFSSAEKGEGLERAVTGAEPELVNFLELLIEKHRMPEIFRIRRQFERALEEGEHAARRDRDQRGRARPGGRREDRRGDREARPARRSSWPAASTTRSSAASCCRSATWSSTRASAVAWRNFERASRSAA